MTLVQFELVDYIGIITLSNPDQLNAMDEAMAKDFEALVSKLNEKISNNELRVIILTGAGRAFSAGGNLEMLKNKAKLSIVENKQRMLSFYRSFLCIRDLGVPLIAAINGSAIGAGLCLACACDIRIAVDSAKLGFTFTRLGLHPGMGATYFLPQVIGQSSATELLLTARVVTAEEALTIKLISSVCAAAGLIAQAKQIASEIISCGPTSVKQLLQSLRGDSQYLKVCLEREADCQSLNYVSSEFMEGVSAAIEKRSAQF